MPMKACGVFHLYQQAFGRALQSFFIVWNRWHIEQFRKDEAWHSLPANHLYLIITTLIRIIIKKEWSNKTWLTVHFALLEMERQASYNAVHINLFQLHLTSAVAVILVLCHGILNFSLKTYTRQATWKKTFQKTKYPVNVIIISDGNVHQHENAHFLQEK